MDADFAVDLLGELVRAYLAATTISYQASIHDYIVSLCLHELYWVLQDCCAFAMQEILLIFECGSEDIERFINHIFIAT